MRRSVSTLVKHLDVSQEQNRRNFARAADQIVHWSVRAEFSYGPKNLIQALQDDYLEMVDLVVAAQRGGGRKLVSQLRSKTESLILNAIRFHLNFFQPSLLGLTEKKALSDLVGKMKRTFAAKNADYGNAFRFWGVPGLVVRMGDKYLRLAQIARENYRAKVADEHVPDTALDLANYGIMLLMLIEEKRSPRLGK